MSARARVLAAHGLEVTVPPGWDGSIRLAAGDHPSTDVEEVSALGTANPVLQVASFALPRVRGDFGGGAVEGMRPLDVFVALVEFDPAAADAPLFDRRGLRRPLKEADFSRATMHRPIPGHSGHQQFFHAQGRAFSLYVALGSHRLRRSQLPRVNAVVGSLSVGRR